MSGVSPARRIALEVLTAVRERDAYANLLLPVLLKRAVPPPAEAAFATELAYGTLRRLGHYDAVLAAVSGREVSAIDPPLLDVLRLAAHQLLATRTAPHAAVHQAVDQARRAAGPRAAGFANAVLRKVGAADDATWTERLTAGLTDPTAVLAARSAHPPWVVAELRSALAATEGGDGDLAALLEVDNVPAPVGLVALPGLAEPADTGLPRHPLSPVGVESTGGDPAAVPGVRAGTVRVQDPGSQLVALALSRARPVTAGERWLDLCAGPGGKAALLAAEAHASGASLVANELVPARARLVGRALAAVPGNHPVEVGDGGRFATGTDRFDRILLDAPCTGLGALRRRPEARWRKRPEDVPELTALQARLLDAAVAALAPGGLLVYATCSPVVAETTDRIAAALAAHPDLAALDTAEVLGRITAAPLTGARRGMAVQLWPHRHATDAMFLQLLARR
ncbi:MAG: RsmB/NOP family class I SAM-dependent RNA methyltransferase [Amnibacterium sp.]